MKKLALIVIGVSALLSGCVAYGVPYSEGYYGSSVYVTGRLRYDDHDRDHRHRHHYRDEGRRGPVHGSGRGYRDRDRDGVPNYQDSSPDNPRRY